MAKLTCPHCKTQLQLSAIPLGQTEPRGVVDQGALRPLRAFLRQLGAGRYPLAEIEEQYALWAGTQRGVRVLRKQSLGKALRELGLKPYRTERHRGFIIDEQVQDGLGYVGPAGADRFA